MVKRKLGDYLLNRVEVAFHALDGHILPSLDRLGF